MSAVVFLRAVNVGGTNRCQPALIAKQLAKSAGWRSEEHTSELQSQSNLVCRLLLEKKKKYGGEHASESTTANRSLQLDRLLNHRRARRQVATDRLQLRGDLQLALSGHCYSLSDCLH